MASIRFGAICQSCQKVHWTYEWPLCPRCRSELERKRWHAMQSQLRSTRQTINTKIPQFASILAAAQMIITECLCGNDIRASTEMRTAAQCMILRGRALSRFGISLNDFWHVALCQSVDGRAYVHRNNVLEHICSFL